MAAGKRPVPFRTRKLSPPAPMVLPPGGSGRVGYRRPNNFTQAPAVSTTLTAGASAYPQPVTHRDHVGGNGALVNETLGHTPHCGQPHPHPSLVHTHGLYESTQHPHRRNTHLGKRGGVVDSCTTGAPQYVLVAPSHAYRLTHCGQQRVHKLWVHTHENPRLNQPAGRDLSQGPIGRGASTRSHDDAYFGTTLRIADKCTCTNNGVTPMVRQIGPGSALRTTGPPPVIGAHPPILRPDQTLHCGQPHPHPSLVHTHENPGATPPSGARPVTGPHRSRGQHTQPR